MRLFTCVTSLFALQLTTTWANTEKTIFLAPDIITLPDAGPSLAALGLDTISSDNTTLRRALPVVFPSQELPRGQESWYLLHNLQPGRRYEVRVCWPAVQPTEFWLETFNLSHVFGTPHLIQSLAAFAEQQAPPAAGVKTSEEVSTSSILFLRLQAAADYFTTNKDLMSHPQLVDVDIVLDPYLANIFPASLVPTALYIVILTLLSFYLSATIWRYLQPHTLNKPHSD
ncbi:uncharacterized protein RHO25_004921 [Cercospora beticola]|uniref:Uncharacterized protein n=1 Tax=Cercospora beticola TaxID=122368 RepID=A0ABZ0NLA7_CERBT|nr:hypothetical protein RHO25_004921 [Cercospora beticola]CAK1361499.1 unnamed protein product [Cercospora beticola]